MARQWQGTTVRLSCGTSFQFGSIELVESRDQCRDVQLPGFGELARLGVKCRVASPAQWDCPQIARLLPASMRACVRGLDTPRSQARHAGQGADEAQVRGVAYWFAGAVERAGS